MVTYLRSAKTRKDLRFYRSNMDFISPGRIDEISNVFNNQAIALSGIRNIDSTLIHMRIRNILKRLPEFKSVLFECPRHNICPCFFTYIDNVISTNSNIIVTLTTKHVTIDKVKNN